MKRKLGPLLLLSFICCNNCGHDSSNNPNKNPTINNNKENIKHLEETKNGYILDRITGNYYLMKRDYSVFYGFEPPKPANQKSFHMLPGFKLEVNSDFEKENPERYKQHKGEDSFVRIYKNDNPNKKGTIQ